MATAGPSRKSIGTTANLAIPSASRTQLSASLTEPAWQPRGKATQGRIVELSYSEDVGDGDDEVDGVDSDSGSEYSLLRIREAADRERADAILKNQEAMREHDARSKKNYQAMLARMRAGEEARRPVGDPHPVLSPTRGDTESADEEICRFLDTGLTAPAEDAITSRPSAPLDPYQPLRRQATAVAKVQSTLGSARPPFPSSGRVRSASPSGKSGTTDQRKRKIFTNTQSSRLDVDKSKENEFGAEYDDEEGDETCEASLEDIRAFLARVDKVRRWLRSVEPANVDEGAGETSAM